MAFEATELIPAMEAFEALEAIRRAVNSQWRFEKEQGERANAALDVLQGLVATKALRDKKLEETRKRTEAQSVSGRKDASCS